MKKKRRKKLKTKKKMMKEKKQDKVKNSSQKSSFHAISLHVNCMRKIISNRHSRVAKMQRSVYYSGNKYL